MIFQGLISLEELDLSHNQLNQLNDDVFGELTKLTILNLMGNEIRTVSGMIVSFSLQVPSVVSFAHHHK